jgi:hypothetical protein
MNSMTFFFKDRWTLQKYINFGLIKARNKSGEDQKNIFAYASIQKDLLEKTPSEFVKPVMKLFFRNHMSKFKEVDLPFYMPQWSGGLGLQCEAQHNTFPDRKVLTSRIKQQEKFKEPPKVEEWIIESKVRDLFREVLPLSETYCSQMMVGDKIYNLSEKEYYSPALALILLTHSLDDIMAPKKQTLEDYIQEMRHRWKTPIIECKVRSLSSLTSRYEPKKFITLIRQ